MIVGTRLVTPGIEGPAWIFLAVRVGHYIAVYIDRCKLQQITQVTIIVFYTHTRNFAKKLNTRNNSEISAESGRNPKKS